MGRLGASSQGKYYNQLRPQAFEYLSMVWRRQLLGAARDRELPNDEEGAEDEVQVWYRDELDPVYGDAAGQASPSLQSLSFWVGRPATLGAGLVDRQSELEALTQAFQAQRVVVLSGGPGCGKSRLAAEYTYSAGVPGFWTAAGRSVNQTLAVLALDLGVEVRGRSEGEIAEEVKRTLAILSSRILWVIDNLDDLDLVNTLVTIAWPHRLLVTSRDARRYLLPNTVAFQPLDVLEPEPAAELLCSRLGNNPQDPSLMQITEVVGRLPLALEMLAVRLGEPRQTPQRLLAELDRAPIPIELATFQRTAGATIPRADGVFGAIVGAIDDLPTDIRECISPIGYVADAPVPDSFLAAITGLDDEGLDRFLAECIRHSIVSLVEGAVTVHALTVAVIAATNQEDAVETTAYRARNRLANIKEDDPVALRVGIGHYEKIHSEAQAQLGPDDPSVLEFSDNLAVAYRTVGRYQTAVQKHEEALAARERVLGPEHPDTLTSRSNLAYAYRSVGRYDESIRMQEEALTGREKVMGPDHPDTLTSRNYLGYSYRLAGRLQEAIQRHEEALAGRDRVLGPDHPDTLRSLDNLAAAYRDAGRYQEAIQLHQRALEARERILGSDHPRTLDSRHNLAYVYRMIGRYHDAIQLHERTLTTREKILGVQHPDTLTTRHNLGLDYRLAGRYEEATKLFEENLASRERILRSDHPLTLVSRHNLASTYRIVGRLQEGVSLNEQTLQARERVLGYDHPDTLRSRHELATNYRAGRRLDDAIQLYQKALEARERVLGLHHPDTLRSQDSLAVAYRSAGRIEEAILLHQKTLATREKVLGIDHPDTLRSRHNLAADYSAAGRLQEAIQLYKDALAGRQQVLGPYHPDTLRSCGNLAASHRSAGQPEEAIQLYEQVVAARERVLGPDHPDTRRVRRTLDRLRSEVSRAMESESTHEGK